MNVLVTGGAGFLGAHLCRALAEAGHEVICLDDMSTGGNIPEGVTLVTQDVRELSSYTVDRIYHLACPASPAHYQADPIGTMRTCVIGTVNVLDMAHATGARVLLASTSEVYGDPLHGPQREDYLGNVNCTGPRACYDEGKRAAEALCYDYRRVHGADIRVARIFNTYGPGMRPDDGRAVSNFVTQALAGRPLVLYGGGSQTRSFCYVDDTIRGLTRLMETDEIRPVNLGNPEEITIRELAEEVVRRVPADIVSTNVAPQDDPKRRCPDIGRAKEVLDWWPRVSLGDGLDRTIGYFRGVAAAA